jgi:hypothetical protein
VSANPTSKTAATNPTTSTNPTNPTLSTTAPTHTANTNTTNETKPAANTGSDINYDAIWDTPTEANPYEKS